MRMRTRASDRFDSLGRMDTEPLRRDSGKGGAEASAAGGCRGCWE